MGDWDKYWQRDQDFPGRMIRRIGLIAAYEDEVKEVLNIPENKNVVVGMALGYPDWESPINRFKAPKDNLEKMIRWIE